MSFWIPALDAANPLIGSHPERYVLRRLAREGDVLDTEMFLGLVASDQSIQEVAVMEEAHQFRTHEAALRAAGELNSLGRGPLDVVKLWDP